ncbi:MAG: FAD-dependent oxidoreductase [Actinomycetota bacterium]
MSEVVVLGGGPAGLMAADRLALAGHRVTLLEASDHLGGMSASIEVGGQRVDLGSHRLHPAAPEDILDLIRELLGPDLQTRPRSGRLRLGDRWVGFPLQFGNLVRTLPPALTARLALDTAGTTIGGLRPGKAAATSFAEEIHARFGPTVGSGFYGPYARKLYGTEPEDLDVELADRRVAASSPADIARRVLRASRASGRVFLYPRRGYGQIMERLADHASDAGAELRTGTPATAVHVENEGVSIDTPDGPIRADVVLASIPRTVLARLLQPAPPDEVLAAVDRHRVRAMVLVYLVLDQPQYTPFDAHYVPDDGYRVARLSEPKNYRDGEDPADRTVLCAEVPCWPGDDIATADAAKLGELVADELGRLGLPHPVPAAVETRYLPSVYPVYDRAGRDDRATLDRWAADLGPVLPFGRQGLGVIDNLHHVLGMGHAAAEVVRSDGSIDRDAWHRHLAAFATNTVED